MQHSALTFIPFRSSESGPVVATVGFFDGVHLGHRYLLEQVKDEARRLSVESMAITFSRHPREVLSADYRPKLLTSYEEKIALLRTTGIDTCSVFDFSSGMARLTAKEFMQQYLKERLNVAVLLLGHDHRFGSDRPADIEIYQSIGKEIGIEVVRAEAFHVADITVSSSYVRRRLQDGDVAGAALALGYLYELSGTVVQGYRVGSKMGFPTANLQPDCSDKLIPQDGVYAVQVLLDGREYGAMLNIGQRPTLDNGEETSIESHLFGFEGDLYGKRITLRFCHRIRDERRFPSKEALQSQLRKDAETAKHILGI